MWKHEKKIINTVHNTTSSHERLFARQRKLTDTQISLCTLPRFTPLLHKLSFILKNHTGQIYCSLQGINNPVANICICNQNFGEMLFTQHTSDSIKTKKKFFMKSGWFYRQLIQIMP